MKKGLNYYWKFLLFFSFPFFIYSQNTPPNYFDIIREKQVEFDNLFKINKNTPVNISLYKKAKKNARWQWFWQNRIDHNGNFNTYNKELFASENIKQLREYTITENKNTDWKILGPETYPKGTNPNGIKGIGRIDAIVVNPKNKKHIIIGARAGGIWETYNGNDSIPHWKCLTNNLPIATVSDLKIVNNTLFAATSNINPILAQGDNRYGLGIIKKKLNDTKWTLPNKTFESRSIAISKKNNNLMYAVGEKAIYKSIDAGDNWIKLTNPIENINDSKIFLTNIEINPYDDDKILISGKLYIYNYTTNNKLDILLFKSENGGQSWDNLTSKLENFINKKIKETKANDPPIITSKGLKNHITTYTYQKKTFICLQQKSNKPYVYFTTLDKEWNNFSLFNSLSKGNNLYYRSDNVDPCFLVLNEDQILIGNRKLRLINNKKHRIKSLDSRYKYLHQDIRALSYNEETGRLLIGTDGGINKAIDNTNNFQFHYFDNLSGNLNLFLAFNMSYINKDEKRTVRIGNQDTGYYKSDNSGEKWSNWERFGPFGEGMIYTDPINPNIVYRINAGGNGGNIQKSINAGESYIDTKTKAGSYTTAPLLIDKNNNNYLVFDSLKKYDQYPLSLSNDQMKSTIDISNGNSDLDLGVNLALAISKKKPTTFYVARKKHHFNKNGINNTLYKSINFDFKNPSKITYINLTDNLTQLDSLLLSQAFITAIEVNDHNENELWISFGNLAKGKKVYHSIDGGLNWKNISFNLPNVPVNTLKYDTVNKVLYLGNDYGVYSQNKVSNQWNRYSNGLPVAIVTSIAIDNSENEIIASTHGRSVWVSPITKRKNHIINKDTFWNSNKTIQGDLIINDGANLTIKNAIVNTNNIIVKNNASLNLSNGKLISNYSNTNNTYFNTNITVNSKAAITFSNSEIKNYNINFKPNSTCKFFGRKKINLHHSKITLFKNANYHQHKKTKIVLNNKDSSILFHNEANFGSSPYKTKLEEIKFKGNGTIRLQKQLCKLISF